MIIDLLLVTAFLSPTPIQVRPDDSPADTIVLLIDFQKDFVEPSGRWPAETRLSQRTLSTVDTLIQVARKRHWQILRAMNDFPQWDVVGNLFRRGAAVRGFPGAAMVAEVDSIEGPVFPKYWPSAFSNRDLTAWSDAHPRTVIWVAGFFADGCVLHTSRDACARGHVVLSSPHLVASPDSVAWRKGWRSLVAGGVREVEFSTTFSANLDSLVKI
jgi:nicotinamidase-related amidase